MNPCIALTTRGGGDWWVVLEGEPGESLATVRDRAERHICGDQWDYDKTMVVQTELKNLTVVSRSKAQRIPWLRRAMRELEYAYD